MTLCATVAMMASSAVWANELDAKLLAAARAGKVDEVVQLLEQGASADARNVYGFTPLMLVCSCFSPGPAGEVTVRMMSVENRKKLVELLLAKSANVNLQNIDGKTALMLAASEGYTVMAFDMGPGPGGGIHSIQAKTKITPNGSPTLVKLLLAKGADCKAKASDGKTAMDLAKECCAQNPWGMVPEGGCKEVIDILTSCSQ